MSDVMKKILDQKLRDRENLTAVELTDKELEKVSGAEWGGFFPSNNSTSLAVTTIAFTTNNNGCF